MIGKIFEARFLVKFNRPAIRFLNMIINSLRISTGTKIPKSTIFHSGAFGSLIHTGVTIGENVHLYPHIILGSKPNEDTIIGDNVIILPGAKIMGGVTIGNNSIIGVNEVIDYDVPPNSKIGVCTLYKSERHKIKISKKK